MYKIAILDTNALKNKGSYGRLVGALRAFHETIPQSKVTVFHRYYDTATPEIIDELKKYHPDFELRRHPWYVEKGSMASTTLSFIFKFLVCAVKQIASRKNSPYFSDFDVLVDLNLIEPDSFNDNKIDPVNIVGQLFALGSIWNATLSRKKYVVCSATIGPYNNSIVRSLATHALNKVSQITLREAFSRDYLRSINIDQPDIRVTADLAFLMDVNGVSDRVKASDQINIAEENVVVGICPAAMMNSRLGEDDYIRLMSDLSTFLTEQYNATILLIANTFQDTALVEKIYERINNPHRTRIIPFSASATDVKSVIGICNLFVCSRFHALVGSTSQGIPSIGLVSYSYNKFHGIIGQMMGLEEYLLDIDQDFDYDIFLENLKKKSQSLLNDGESLHLKLLQKTESVKKEALQNGQLVSDLISRTKPHEGE